MSILECMFHYKEIPLFSDLFKTSISHTFTLTNLRECDHLYLLEMELTNQLNFLYKFQPFKQKY